MVEIPIPSPTNKITFLALPDSVTMLLLAVCAAPNFVCASLNHALLVSEANCSFVSDVAGALHTKLVELTSSLSSTSLLLVSAPT